MAHHTEHLLRSVVLNDDALSVIKDAGALFSLADMSLHLFDLVRGGPARVRVAPSQALEEQTDGIATAVRIALDSVIRRNQAGRPGLLPRRSVVAHRFNDFADKVIGKTLLRVLFGGGFRLFFAHIVSPRIYSGMAGTTKDSSSCFGGLGGVAKICARCSRAASPWR